MPPANRPIRQIVMASLAAASLAMSAPRRALADDAPSTASYLGFILLASRPEPTDAAGWRATSEARRAVLVDKVFGGFPAAPSIAPSSETSADGNVRLVRFQSEPGNQPIPPG